MEMKMETENRELKVFENTERLANRNAVSRLFTMLIAPSLQHHGPLQ